MKKHRDWKLHPDSDAEKVRTAVSRHRDEQKPRDPDAEKQENA